MRNAGLSRVRQAEAVTLVPDPDDVLELFLGFWISRTVMAAVELGVFELLDGQNLALEEAQARLGLSARPARALLDTCVATRLLEKEDGRYRNAPLASRYLAAGSEYSMRNYVLDERWCWAAWSRLEDAVRADAQLLPPDEEGYHAFPEEFFLDFLHGHSLAMGERLAGAVDLGAARRMMDVGGGSGAVSIALCRANPGLGAVVVDQAPVAARAAHHIAAAGLSERIATWPAKMFETGCRPTATSPSWPTCCTTSHRSGHGRSSAGWWPPCRQADGWSSSRSPPTRSGVRRRWRSPSPWP
jgi:hypothetical protein